MSESEIKKEGVVGNRPIIMSLLLLLLIDYASFFVAVVAADLKKDVVLAPDHVTRIHFSSS